MRLGEIIKKYRTEHEMSMSEFAKISGLSKQYVSVLEQGKHPTSGKSVAPSLIIIKKVAIAMGIPFDDLFAMLDDEVTLNTPEEASKVFKERVMEPFNAKFAEKNKSESTFEELRTAYARSRNKLTREERMQLAAEILMDDEPKI